MVNKLIFPLIVILAALPSCKENKELSTQGSMSVEADVQQMLSAMSDSLRISGSAGWLPFLHESPEFTWEFQGHKTTYDSLRARELRESPQYTSINLVWDSIQVQPIAFGKATVFATYIETFVDTTGRQSMVTGSVKATLVKVADLWKIQHGEDIRRSTRNDN
jgi:hypothetical protein